MLVWVLVGLLFRAFCGFSYCGFVVVVWRRFAMSLNLVVDVGCGLVLWVCWFSV